MIAGTATFVSASISTVAKFVIDRARPYTGLGDHFFKPFSFSDDDEPFPSGHIVVAFSITSVLAERIGNPWTTAGLYGLATATALGRIYTWNHWLSDVVPAAIFSSVIGGAVVRWYEQSDPNDNSSVMIIPGAESLTIFVAL
jgi:membrane-associated phospholipid phosphatase